MMSPEPSAQEASPATNEATESWPGTVAHMRDKNRGASVEVEPGFLSSVPLPRVLLFSAARAPEVPRSCFARLDSPEQ